MSNDTPSSISLYEHNRICFEMREKIEAGVLLDKKRLDWLEALMTPADDFCEVFFAGLRHGIGERATAFQIESNPEKFPTTQRATLRECIDAVLQPNQRLGCHHHD